MKQGISPFFFFNRVFIFFKGSADVLWRLFVCRDFNLTPPQVRLFMVEHVSIRRLYVSYGTVLLIFSICVLFLFFF